MKSIILVIFTSLLLTGCLSDSEDDTGQDDNPVTDVDDSNGDSGSDNDSGDGSDNGSGSDDNTTNTWGTSVVINEVVASNFLLDDEDGSSPDWIELYNSTSASISLAGWFLSDDEEALNKWALPDIQVEAGHTLHIWASDKDRSTQNYYSALVSENDQARYVIPDGSTDSDWRNLSFNDSSWTLGNSGFGYGDNDDNTIVANGTLSVFARYEFDIADVSSISQLLFNIDYDDGFVAYLNGVEIARANLGTSLPPHDEVAHTLREATLVTEGTTEQFDVSAFIDALVDGNNVLAVQGHNASSDSSDLTLNPFLTALYSGDQTDIRTPVAHLNLLESQLHTNFKISNSEPETVYLSNDDIEVVDSLLIKNIPLNGSYGRNEDGDVGYFLSPTPYQANTSTLYEDVVTNVVSFSHKAGVVGETFLLSLTGAGEQETIRYTLDGSEPNESSEVFSSAITVDENTVIKAAIFAENSATGKTETRSWIFNTDHSIAVVSLVGDPDELFDEVSGMYMLGTNASSDFPFFGANFWEDTEVEMEFSYFPNDDRETYSSPVGAKIFGGWSRGNEQRSFSLFARGRYGNKDLDYVFFPEQDYDEFQSIVLRNSGQDWMKTMYRDVALTSLTEGTGIEYQSATPVVVYINGDYWGLYNIREKVNEHFIESKTGIDTDNINMVAWDGEQIHGDSRDYLDLMAYVENADTTDNDVYQYITDKIDIDNYTIYNVLQIFFDNHDWPGNNNKAWQEVGGKWRWIMYDTDFSFNLFPEWHEEHSYNSLYAATTEWGGNWPNPPASTFLLRKMLENPDFEQQFVVRFADELNSRLLPSHIIEHFAEFADAIEDEIPAATERWLGYDASSDWNNENDKLNTFAELRPQFVWQHIQEYFGYDDPITFTVIISGVNGGSVLLNSLEINQAQWQGTYFTETPLSLTAIPNDGYTFSHWTIGDQTITTSSIEVTLDSVDSVTAVFVAN